MKKKAWLFDCDGTLVDSEILAMGVAIDILAEATQQHRPEVSIDRGQLVQDYAGWHFSKMIGAFEKNYGVSLDHSAVDSLKVGATLESLKQVKPCDGIEEALTAISSRYEIALVTSSEFSRVNLSVEVAGLDPFFVHSRRYSAHDSLPEPKHKPHPDIYTHARMKECFEAEECGAVEDSPSGVEAAYRDGIRDIVGYVGASHIPEHRKASAAEQLLEKGARVVIRNMQDLPAIVRAIDEGLDFSNLKLRGQIWVPSAHSRETAPGREAFPEPRV